MSNNGYTPKKNMFSLGAVSEQEKRRRAREGGVSQEPSTSRMARMYTQADKSLKAQPKTNNWYGGNADKFDLGSLYGEDGYTGAHSKWDNYGSSASGGGAYATDFEFHAPTDENLRNYYTESMAYHEQQQRNQDQVYKQYQQAISDANTASQKVSIGKMVDMKNAQSQSTALGRGGLGTTESGQSRINNNYLNRQNEINKNTNTSIGNMYDSYNTNNSQMESAAKGLESNAKINQTNYLLSEASRKWGKDANGMHGSAYKDKFSDFYYGDDIAQFDSGRKDEEGNAIMIDNPHHGAGKDYWGEGGFKTDTNEDGIVDGNDTNPYSGQYLTAGNEKEILDALEEYFNGEEQKYFLANSAENKDALANTIKGYGSGREGYANANDMYKQYVLASDKFDLENSADRFEDRGAAGNGTAQSVGLSKDNWNQRGGSATTSYKVYDKVSDITYSFNDGYSRVKNFEKENPTIANGKINGDIVRIDDFYYYKRNGKWYKLS